MRCRVGRNQMLLLGGVVFRESRRWAKGRAKGMERQKKYGGSAAEAKQAVAEEAREELSAPLHGGWLGLDGLCAVADEVFGCNWVLVGCRSGIWRLRRSRLGRCWSCSGPFVRVLW